LNARFTIVDADKFFDEGHQRRGADGFLYIDNLPAGASCWIGDALQFMCPCGCGMVGGLSVAVDGQAGPQRWKISGPREAPTLEPSIQMMGACRWHGHLKEGVYA
jgi:hypothetical protein